MTRPPRMLVNVARPLKNSIAGGPIPAIVPVLVSVEVPNAASTLTGPLAPELITMALPPPKAAAARPPVVPELIAMALPPTIVAAATLKALPELHLRHPVCAPRQGRRRCRN